MKNVLDTIKEVRQLFSGVVASHYYCLKSPRHYGYSKGLFEPPTELYKSDIEDAIEIAERLEKNGVNWAESVNLGSLERAFLEVRVERLKSEGY